MPPFRVPGGEQRSGPPARQAQAPGHEPQGAFVDEEGLYIISVAARILHMHPQTLRKYERARACTAVADSRDAPPLL